MVNTCIKEAVENGRSFNNLGVEIGKELTFD